MNRHPFGKSALIVAHPGHELRVHGWLEVARPTVYVLTDGSGRASHSRLNSTTRLLAQVGARRGFLYGQHTDRELYTAVLRYDARFFSRLALMLTEDLVREQYDFVLGDASEGLILAHDLWRGVIDTALAAAQTRRSSTIASYAFSPEGPPPGEASAELSSASIVLRLDDAALERKLAAIHGYAELQAESQAFLTSYGPEGLRFESLWRGHNSLELGPQFPAAYERHGETLVAQGVYPAVVRYQDHVAPILSALRTLARAA